MNWRYPLALLLMALAPVTARSETQPGGAVPAALPPSNSPVFARLPPAPGAPTYLQTIRFIDDGMRYVDPLSAFFISPFGEMCFRIRPASPQISYFYAAYRDWCIYPRSVDRVEAATDDISGIYKVRLWCAHAYPQCAHNELGWIANNIAAGTIDYLQERDAVIYLIRQMGGNVRTYSSAAEAEPPVVVRER